MTAKITRRNFLRRVALGAAAAALAGQVDLRWLGGELLSSAAAAGVDGSLLRPGHWGEIGARQSLDVVSDDEIPTEFFRSGYTQDRFENALQTGDLVVGFPYGLIDTHTKGGVPFPKSVTIDENDGSAVLTVRRMTPLELEDLELIPSIRALMLDGEKNGLFMGVSVAALTGRLPTDLRSIEATIALPQRVITGNPNVGMVGVGWTLWTLPDVKRLAANLERLGVPLDEASQICWRVENSFLEEDVAEMGIAEPSVTLGDPLMLRLFGGHILFFMAGRKTPTQKHPKADIMHMLREPLALDIPPGLSRLTIRGWLAQNGENQDQALRRPLKVRMDIGAEVYDPTRDAMVVPMEFRLNGQLLTPSAVQEFPGFEVDKGGNTIPNLSIWKIRTRHGDWVTIPRHFIIDYGTLNRAGPVIGETDWMRFSNIIITRGTASPPTQ